MDAAFFNDCFYPIMKGRLTMCVIATCVVAALVLGFVIFLFCYYKEVKGEEKSASSAEELSEAKRDKRKIIVYAMFIAVLCGCASPTIVKDIHNHAYDINHKACVLVEGDFVVESATYGWGRFADDVYTLTYERDGQTVSVDIVTTECPIDVGNYTDAVLIYSSRAKIVLSLEGNPTDNR